ncbi:uncharacterized protein LOC124918866 isoform X2 [Impatiens glandulifera]|uniref:uncharacterized protein LOC124918866 isoform X2 n=1 Tax=Impatiens glandulifera TaxID=253017 RepID=UPI001FB15540|nr:uncharacterized protein LOC124918866 isoform X2 [Impatiens glandulifera]
MALSLRGKSLFSRLKTLLAIQRFKHTAAETGSDLELERGKFDISRWKKLDSRTLGITRSMISPSSYMVLKILKNAGFEAYLVGGCVRDLILNKVPKDFDVITTAALKQIRKEFNRAQIIGQRFPICLVHLKGSAIEVSSFQTGKAKEKKESLPQMPRGFDEKDIRLWSDSMRRDFTVNSLFFDPFANKVYDYSGAVMDLKSLKLQTLIPAQMSFEEDCARILRGLRIAARIGLSISKEIEAAIHKLSSSIASLAKSRLMMEMNYMLSYGAAEASICLLWRFHLLKTLLPLHDAHLAYQINGGSDMNSLFVMRLFSNLDKLVTCDRPCDCILWVAILSFHLSLLNKPQAPLVIWTFGYLLYNDNWSEGVQFARKKAEGPIISVAEISESSNLMSNAVLLEKVAQLAITVQSSVYDLTGINSSGLVYIPKNTAKRTDELFNVLAVNASTLKSTRKRLNIDYDLLGKGDMSEIRFALGRIILDTMSSFLLPQGDGNSINKKTAKLPNFDIIHDIKGGKSSCLVLEEQNVKKNKHPVKLKHANVSKGGRNQVLQNEEKDQTGVRETVNKNQQHTKLELESESKIEEIDPIIHCEKEMDHEKPKKIKENVKKSINKQGLSSLFR